MSEKVQLAIHKGRESEIEMGGLRFRACRREIEGIDGGVTLQVMGPSQGAERELLRIDCFRKRPHYHAPGDNPDETKIDVDGFEDACEWVYARLAKDAPQLFAETGWDIASEGVDLDALRGIVPRLRALLDALPEPSETSFFEIDAALLGEPAGRSAADGSPASAHQSVARSE